MESDSPADEGSWAPICMKSSCEKADSLPRLPEIDRAVCCEELVEELELSARL